MYQLRGKGNTFIRLNEFNRISDLLVTLLNIKDDVVSLKLLTQRIKNMFITASSIKTKQGSGVKFKYRFFYQYLKDVHHIFTFWLADQLGTQTKFRVSVDKSGLPKLLPFHLRTRLLLIKSDQSFKDHQALIVGISTILSLYRVVKYFPIVDYSSIESPFSGVTTSFNLNLIEDSMISIINAAKGNGSKIVNLHSLRHSALREKGKLLLSESAGPSYGPATLGSVHDA
jgi:hypothetical protein